MSFLDAILLGVIQGLTEFFPVSSSGHLVLGQALLGLEIPGIVFDVSVHVATLISVVVVYRQRLLSLIRGMRRRGSEGSWPYIFKLGAATVPAAIVGITLQDWFEARFDEPVFAATMILVTGAVVWSSRWALGSRRIGLAELVPIVLAAVVSLWVGTIIPFLAVLALETILMAVARRTSARERSADEPTWGAALLMGGAQAIAIFPGISRSGSTVLAGLWRSVDPVRAAEFSFLMSIPAILGAAVLQLPDAVGADLGIPLATLSAGFLGAMLSGILAIRFFVALLRRRNFFVFAYYCWMVGTLFLLLT